MSVKYQTFTNPDQCESGESTINHIVTTIDQNEPEVRHDESGLMKANENFKIIFTYLGIYLIEWNHKTKEYERQKKLFVLSYILWFLWPMLGISLAYFGSKYLGIDDITDGIHGIHGEVHSMKSISICILMLALIPAFQTYAIWVFTKNLPLILQEISDLYQKDDSKLEYRLNELKEANINIFINRDADDEYDREFTTWLPKMSFAFAGLAFLTSAIWSIIDYTTRGSVFQEWYFLVMIAFYLFLPVFTTWFCIIFIEWQRKVYRKVNDYIGDNLTNITLENLKSLDDYSDKIQDIFIHLSNGVLKYPLGINMLVYLATSTFCASRMLADTQYIYYVFPLSVSAGHIIILCARCSELMKEYRNVLSKLKDVIDDLEKEDNDNQDLIEELRKLRENLHDSPPQVVIFGSFTVDYGMLSTIIGFIISYALLINELFEHDITVCNVVNPSIATSTAPIITGSAVRITTSTIDTSNPSAVW